MTEPTDEEREYERYWNRRLNEAFGALKHEQDLTNQTLFDQIKRFHETLAEKVRERRRGSYETALAFIAESRINPQLIRSLGEREMLNSIESIMHRLLKALDPPEIEEEDPFPRKD